MPAANQMQRVVVKDPEQLAQLRSDWNALSERSQAGAATYDRYEQALAVDGAGMRLIALRDADGIATLAPFVLRPERKKFTVGERRLFSLPIRTMRLIGANFLGEVSAQTVGKVFDELLAGREFDMVSLRELAIDGPLYVAVQAALTRSKWRCTGPAATSGLHWLIDLPETFDDYVARLSAKTRQTMKRKLRNFDATFGGRMQCITQPEQVDGFLEIGERISRLTYQWNVGQQLRFDDRTRQAYLDRARRRKLRCYLLFAGEQPCAFLRGDLDHGVYHYETPGFDPQFSRASPGTVLLLKVLEDLIANSDCKVFDFGVGGDEIGYKAVFGTRSYACIQLDVVRKWRAYPMLLTALQGGLATAKRVGNAILREGPIKRAIKRAMRKYDA